MIKVQKIKTKNILKALFLRELQTRFFSQQFGLLWGILDMMVFIVVFSIIKSQIFENSFSNVDFIVFLTIGFLGFFLWKNILLKTMESFNANSGLFIYQPVRPIFTIFSRFLVEIFLFLLTLFIFIFIGFYFNYDIYVDNFVMVFFAFFWLSIFGLSLGLLSATLSNLYESYNKIIKIIITPLIFISAIMYSVESLPQTLQNIILLNPLTHFMEMIHGFYFNSLNDSYVNYYYLSLWTFLPLFLGLFLYRKHEQRIISL